MKNEFVEDCQLEWQKERGVIYVHNKKTGQTVLRISGVRTEGQNPGTLDQGMIDLTNPEHVSFPFEPYGRYQR